MTKSTLIKDNCGFCGISKKRGTPSFMDLYDGLSDKIPVAKMPHNFYALQNITPVQGTHGAQFLLLPKKHLLSMSQSIHKKSLQTAISIFIAFIQNLYPNKPILIFEHGSGIINKVEIECGGCHIYHAHINFIVLPSYGDFYPDIKHTTENSLAKSGWDRIKQRCVTSPEFICQKENKPYLEIGIVYPNGYKEFTLYRQEKEEELVQSQLLRKIVSQVVYHKTLSSYWHWSDMQTLVRRSELFDAINESRTNLHFSLKPIYKKRIPLVTGPYAGGKKLVDVLVKYRVRSLEAITATDPSIYKQEVMQPNIDFSLAFGAYLQSNNPSGIIDPIRAYAKGFLSNHYRDFWRNIVLRNASVLYVTEDWAYSIGQTHNIGAALEKNIPIYEQADSTILTKDTILKKLEKAISYVQKYNLDIHSKELEQEFQAIKSYRRWDELKLAEC